MRYLSFISILLFFPSSVFAKEIPVEIAGKWEVSEVHINAEATRTPLYTWNDPRLIGRIFIFKSNKITNDTLESSECSMPNAKKISVDMKNLISKSMAGYGYPAQSASIKSYQLDSFQNKAGDAVQFYCGHNLWNGDLGMRGGIRGSWLFILDNNQILLRWYDETILILDRISNDKKPNPSFDCLKASTPSEHKICESIELSAFDRSVSLAYRNLLSQYRDAGNDPSRIIQEQKNWIIARNKCDANRKCIISSMQKRLDELSVPPQ